MPSDLLSGGPKSLQVNFCWGQDLWYACTYTCIRTWNLMAIHLQLVVSIRWWTKSLHGEWLEITKHPFKTGCLEFHICCIQYTYYVFERLHWPSWKSSPSSPWDHAAHRWKWKTWPQEKLCFPHLLVQGSGKNGKNIWTRKDVLIKIVADPSYHDRLVD